MKNMVFNGEIQNYIFERMIGMYRQQEYEHLLTEEQRLFDETQKFEPDTEEYQRLQHMLGTVRRQICDVFDTQIDFEKVTIEDKRECKKNRINLWLGVAGLVLPMIFNCYWMTNGFKFEETGNFTSKTFNWLIQNQFRKK